MPIPWQCISTAHNSLQTHINLVHNTLHSCNTVHTSTMEALIVCRQNCVTVTCMCRAWSATIQQTDRTSGVAHCPAYQPRRFHYLSRRVSPESRDGGQRPGVLGIIGRDFQVPLSSMTTRCCSVLRLGSSPNPCTLPLPLTPLPQQYQNRAYTYADHLI